MGNWEGNKWGLLWGAGWNWPRIDSGWGHTHTHWQKNSQKNTRSDIKIQKYSSIQIFKYLSIQVSSIKYSSIQVFKYSSIQYSIIQVFKYKYTSIQVIKSINL